MPQPSPTPNPQHEVYLFVVTDTWGNVATVSVDDVYDEVLIDTLKDQDGCDLHFESHARKIVDWVIDNQLAYERHKIILFYKAHVMRWKPEDKDDFREPADA